MKPVIAALCAWLPLAAAEAPESCHALKRRGPLPAARACYSNLARSADPYLRAEAFWGLENYQEANEQFKLAVARSPKNAGYRVRWGRLFLERFNPAEAAKLFQEALEIDGRHAAAFLGLALAASENFERKAVELAEKALEIDAGLLEARELLARLALEESDRERAVAQAEKALALSAEALDALAILAAIDWLDDRETSPALDRILKVNPLYGEAHMIGARILVLNRRYEEAIRHYRRAIELNPSLWSARSELGINLMRLGQDQEARDHLERCYASGYRNAATVNSLRLLDSYKNFQTFTGGNTVLKLHKKEAELLRPYFETELKRAMATFDKKYKVALRQPVQVEVYPDHEDFAVRTMGMPGLGALGVTFGTVVAMDSPSGRKPGHFHWASTLWHELSHVYVLTATRHRVPRWFTEGMAVHEETAASPDWGDRLSPEVVLAIRDKKLLPVTELDRGFIRPSGPAQVGVSYYQAGRICDYINQKWGYGTLLAMMHSFGERQTTAAVVKRHLGLEAADFDKQFLGWLESQHRQTIQEFDRWKKGMGPLVRAARAGHHDEVLRDAPALRELYPEYVEEENVYELLARAWLARGDKPAAARELERYAAIGGRDPAALKQLAALQAEAGRKKEAAATLDRINLIYPVSDEELHRRLGDLWFELGDFPGAIREYSAVVALRPLDQAASHYNLAKAYYSAKRSERAREHLLLALEAAPGYRPAQKMLLDLHRNEREKQ